MMTNRKMPKHFKRCIFGGAIGDASGAPIEFISIFGNSRLTSYSEV